MNSAWRRLWGLEGDGSGDTPMTGLVVRLLAVATVVTTGLLLVLVLQLWPAAAAAGTAATKELPDPPAPVTAVTLFGQHAHLSRDIAVIWLAVAMGALGGLVHAATSLGKHVGLSDFHPQWTTWYVLRPFVGAVVALIGYLVARGGLIGVSSDTAVNPYGVAGIAAVSGLFARQAVDKLAELVNVLFAPAAKADDAARPATPPAAAGPAPTAPVDPAAALVGPPVSAPSSLPSDDATVQAILANVAGAGDENAVRELERAQLTETDKGSDAPAGGDA